jgi:hypothetical protein
VDLPPDVIENFNVYLTEHLLNPYLLSATEGLETGPVGGRLTGLLALVDPSATMHCHLNASKVIRRFNMFLLVVFTVGGEQRRSAGWLGR